MSDLSRLLGDVYGATPPAEDVDAGEPTAPVAVPAAADDPPAPPVEAAGPGSMAPAAPGWADESVLDEAFAEWVPGPPSDAVAEERDMLTGVEPAETVAEPVDIDAWLGDDPVGAEAAADDATAAYDAFVPLAEPEPGVHDMQDMAEMDAMEAMDANWTRHSDDLLPRARRTRRLSLQLRR